MRNGASFSMTVDGVYQRQWSQFAEPLAYLEVGGKDRDGRWHEVDDVRIYRRLLTATDIAALMSMAADAEETVPVAAAAGTDDAVEAPDGTVTVDDTELALGTNAVGGANLVGVRFPGVVLPRGATILQASIEFTGRGVTPEPSTLVIECEATDNAASFAATPNDISARVRTRTGMPWTVPSVSNETVLTSPDVAAMLQEVVDRNGWTSGNALGFLLSGSGERRVDACDKVGGHPARLRVMWVDALDRDGDGLPDSWERVALPGRASENDPNADSDGDGVINLSEFIMGTDGSDPADVLNLGIRTAPDGRPVVWFPGKGVDGVGYAGTTRYYYLDSMTNLLTDSWTCIDTITNLIDRLIECTNDVGTAGSAFYRARVDLDLSNLPMPPTADAGPDQVTTNTSVTLDGSGSTDPNGDP